MLSSLKKTLLAALLASAAAATYAQAPSCSGVHVWYTLTNDSAANWAIQIARLYENNISFVDETCAPVDLNNKLLISPAQSRYVGMKVDAERGFYATYSFMGVQTGNATGADVYKIAKGVPACAFAVAPYAPGQMDRVDWKINNADCYANNYGTEIHFK